MAVDQEKLLKGVLKGVLKEIGKGKEDPSAYEKVASAEAAKAREGKGFFGGAIAEAKARSKVSDEWKIATQGTTGKRTAFFEGLLGRDLGNLVKSMGLEKMESPEAIKEARAKFGLDKKEKGDKGGGIGKLAKPLSIILRKVIETQKMVKNIEKAMTKPSLKLGYTFDPRMSGGGRYKNAEGKLVGSKEALDDGAQASRTAALTAAIGADEQPLVKLREFLEEKFKDFDPKKMQKDVGSSLFSLNGMTPTIGLLSVHDKLNLILAKFKLGGVDLPNKRTPPGKTPPGKTPPGKTPPGETSPGKTPPGETSPGKTPPAETPPGKTPPVETPPGKTSPGGFSKVGKALGKAARVVGKFAGPLAVGMAAYDAYQGATNAEETLGLQKGQTATTGQKFAAAAGGVISGLTFGLVDAGKVGRFLSGTEENPTDANLEKYVVKKDAGVNLSGLKPEMQKRLAGLAYEYFQKTGQKIQINSGYRDSKEQAELYAKYGPPRAAPPGRSRHESGLAVDINSSDANKAVELGLMAKYGFTRPVPGETWHVEPVEVARKNPTPDNPYAPGAPVVVANAGGKPASPDTGKKPPPAVVAEKPPASVTADASTSAPPAPTPPATSTESISTSAIPETPMLASASTSDAPSNDYAGEFAEGGMIPSGKVGLVGERGPELVSGPANVTSTEETKEILFDKMKQFVKDFEPVQKFFMGEFADKLYNAALEAEKMKESDSDEWKNLSSAEKAAIEENIKIYKEYAQNMRGEEGKAIKAEFKEISAFFKSSSLSKAVEARSNATNISPVQNTLGTQTAAESKNYENNKLQMQAAPAAPVVINNNQGGAQQPITPPKQPLPKASSRSSENAFNRALAKDFSHPTAFTSVGMV